jgi:hypothetical protein
MTLAMMLGMCVLGMAFSAIHIALFGTGFDDAWHQHTELTVFAMTFNMTLPMVLWMRYRDHSWQRCAEMAAAMFILGGSPRAVLARRFVGAGRASAGDGADDPRDGRRDAPSLRRVRGHTRRPPVGLI